MVGPISKLKPIKYHEPCHPKRKSEHKYMKKLGLKDI